MAADHQLTWTQTRQLINSDFARLMEWYGGGSPLRRVFWFCQPNYQAMFWYRLYRYLYLKGWPSLARSLALWSLYLTGAEISCTTSIGPSCLIAHALGVVLFGKFGARFSVYCQAGTGGGIGETDIGGGPGYPVVGDDVVFAVHSMALGAIRIGNGAFLGPAAVVMRDIPDGARVIAVPPKIVKARAANDTAGLPDPGGVTTESAASSTVEIVAS